MGTFAKFDHDIGKMVLVNESTGEVVESRGREPYDDEVAEQFVLRILGGEAMTKICIDPRMPSYSTILRWRRENEDFDQMIRQAREDSAEGHYEALMGYLAQLESNPSRDEASAIRTASDLRKWIMTNLSPRQYGQSKDQGGGGGVTIVIDTGIRRVENIVEPAPGGTIVGNSHQAADVHIESTADDNGVGDSRTN